MTCTTQNAVAAHPKVITHAAQSATVIHLSIPSPSRRCDRMSPMLTIRHSSCRTECLSASTNVAEVHDVPLAAP